MISNSFFSFSGFSLREQIVSIVCLEGTRNAPPARSFQLGKKNSASTDIDLVFNAWSMILGELILIPYTMMPKCLRMNNWRY